MASINLGKLIQESLKAATPIQESVSLDDHIAGALSSITELTDDTGSVSAQLLHSSRVKAANNKFVPTEKMKQYHGKTNPAGMGADEAINTANAKALEGKSPSDLGFDNPLTNEPGSKVGKFVNWVQDPNNLGQKAAAVAAPLAAIGAGLAAKKYLFTRKAKK